MSQRSEIELHLSAVESSADLHALLFERFDLPDYYGANWDAFWDVITAEDVLPRRLVLHGWFQLKQRLPREAELMRECLAEYQKERPDRPCQVVYVPPAHKPYPCPCCGHFGFDEPPGSYEICPVCFWEDDALQLEFATTLAGGANKPSLLQAQRNYAVLAACEERLRPYVRAPQEDEPRDPSWRPVDPERDIFEDFEAAERPRAPTNDESLYYWRSAFWRRPSAQHAHEGDEGPGIIS